MKSRTGDDILADYMRAALAPCQDEGLLSHRALEDICRSNGASLPPGITSLFGFECPLGQEEPAADFLVRVGAEPEEWPVLRRFAREQEDGPWRRIGALADEHALPDSPLPALLQNLWVEYDLIHPLSIASTPSAFFGTERLIKGADTAWAAVLVERLRGEPLSGGARCRLSDLVAVLPEGAKLFQVGVMCSRPRAPLRVCVIMPHFEQLSAFLAAAHWPGNWTRIHEVLKQFTSIVDQFAVGFDILDDGRLSQKLGIELYQNPEARSGRRLTELVRRLTDCALCTPQKAEGLLAWDGITHERRYPDLWPATLIALRAARGGSESSTFCRWLHHTKITFAPHNAPTAKAYLATKHAFLSDAVIREALHQAALDRG